MDTWTKVACASGSLPVDQVRMNSLRNIMHVDVHRQQLRQVEIDVVIIKGKQTITYNSNELIKNITSFEYFTVM